MPTVDLSAIVGPEAQARLDGIGNALGLMSNRLLSRNCISGFHGKCDGNAQAARQHPTVKAADQPLPCFCGCHEGFKPR